MSGVVEDQKVEIRCPQGPKNLLMKLQRDPSSIVPVTEGLMELLCRDCTRHARRQMRSAGLSENFRIVHRFNFAGEFVESVRQSMG